jgi:chlorite dismutase
VPRVGTISAMAEEAAPAQYVAYTLYRVDPAWRRLPVEERQAGKEAFAEVVADWATRIDLRAYSTIGVRPDVDFFHWKLTERFEDLRELATDLNATPLAPYLETPYSYLAATKPSKYFPDKEARRRAPRRVVPRGAPYLVVYPFVKRREWYALPMEDRSRAMREHAEIGSRFTTITNHTTYSFGIDDQEFMTAFECESPEDFLELMMTLRETEASRYTERDTPIFVGEAMETRAILDALDGAAARVGSR